MLETAMFVWEILNLLVAFLPNMEGKSDVPRGNQKNHRPQQMVRDNSQRQVQQVHGQVDLLNYFQMGVLVILSTLLLIQVWIAWKRARSFRKKKRKKCISLCLRCARRENRRRNACNNQEEGNDCDAAKEMNEGKESEEENETDEINNNNIECVIKNTTEESETMIIHEGTEGHDHSNQVSEGPEHSNQVSEGPEHSNQVSEGPEHSNQVSEGPEHSNQVSEGPEHSNQVSESPEHSIQVTEGPQNEECTKDMNTEDDNDNTKQICEMVKEMKHQQDNVTPCYSKEETEPTQEINEIKGSKSQACVDLCGDNQVVGIERREENSDVSEEIEQRDENIVSKQNKVKFVEKTTVVMFHREDEPKEVKHAVKEVGELNEEPRERKLVKVKVAHRKRFGNSWKTVDRREADQGSGTNRSAAAYPSVPSCPKLLVYQKTAQKQDSIGFEQKGCRSSNYDGKEMEELSVEEVRREKRGFRPERRTRSVWSQINDHLQPMVNEFHRDREQNNDYVGFKHKGHAATYNGGNKTEHIQ